MKDITTPAFLQPQLGLGCLYKETAGLVPDAFQKGITFFDTSNVYDNGNTEIALGNVFANLPRERFQIATKCGCTVLNGKFKTNGSEQHILSSCDKSLKALKLNYIDLYYLHRVDPKVDIEISMGAFRQLLQEGKIKHVGLSEVTPSQIRRAHAVCTISAVQVEYSPWSRQDEHNGVIETCRELGIAIVTYSPLGRALFTNEFNGQLSESDYRNNINRYKNNNVLHNMKIREELNAFIQEKLPNVTLSQFILAWQIHKGFIPIPSTTKLKHFKENCGAIRLKISTNIFETFDQKLNEFTFQGERYSSQKSSRIYNGIPFIPKTERVALLSTDPHITTLHKITYEKLHGLTDRIAFRLTEQFRPKSVIAVYLPQSIDYVIAMLAIWKAGMIYFPLNNKSTLNTAQIEKAKAQLLDQTIYEKLSQPAENTFSFKPIELFDNDWVYYIASSGTTSAPKIIRIRFEALMSRIRDHQQRMNIRKKNNDVMLALLNCAFDASMMEMLSALTKGIPLFVAPETIRENVFNLPKLFSLAHENGFAITTGIFVPSILNGMSPEGFPGLKSFLTTGENIDAKQIKTWLDAGIAIFNGYGPTEVTFGASIVQITDPQNIFVFFENSTQNNGLFSGLVCLCLKKSDETPQAKWKTWDNQDDEGEVFLTGYAGLGDYLDDPERNEKKFIPREKYADYFAPSVIEKIQRYPRVYQVNDIVRRLENRFVFVRRSDRIIKWAGKQVDLEEIETRFKKEFPGLDITVIHHNRLIRAFINSATIPLVSRLEGQKPNIYYCLDKEKFEQENQSNSKLKKTFETLEPFSQKIFPLKENFSSTEQKVAELWQRLFDEDMAISLDTDFTEELGGESLLRMQMTNMVWNELLDETVREQSASTVEFSRYIHKNKTIRKIATLVDACNSTYLHCDQDFVFSFTEAASSNISDEAIIVSAILQIRRQQKIGPYILFCSNKNQMALYEKLKTQLQASQEEVSLAIEPSELENLKNQRTQKRLLNKLKKTQQDILDEKLPEQNFVDLDATSSILLTGTALSGKTTALKHLIQSHWSDSRSDDKKSLVIYFSLKNGRITAISDWLCRWLEPDEIACLQKNYAVIFLLDDYDLLARNDFPDIRLPASEWPNVKYIIACRSDYLNIPESREAFKDFNPIALPASRKIPSTEYETARSGKIKKPMPKIASETNYQLPVDAKEVFVPIVEGQLAKPIFAFAPITGDVTEYYRKLSSQLGFQQPFYVFFLPSKGLGCSPDLNERAAYYASIIQAKYPQGEMILLGWSFGAFQAYATARILQQQNRMINTIINIDSAWPTNLSGFNVTQQLEKMKPRLDEIYAKNPEGRDTGIENTKCNLETYFRFMQQELENPRELSIPMVIFKAEKPDTGLTEKPEFDWPCEKSTFIEIKKSDHFNIFEKPEFIASIKAEVAKHQPIASHVSLKKRLSDYKQSRLENASQEATQKMLPLFVTAYPKPNAEIVGATAILENNSDNKTIILCGEPGGGKSTTLKLLEPVALKQGYIPIVIKLKEYHSTHTITEKLLQTGLNLQEILTGACKNLIFFLDGLDELDDKTLINEIMSLLRPQGRIIISTRTHVYEKLGKETQDAIGPRIRYDLNALTSDQIKSFLESPEDYDFIAHYPEMLELCKNPLTLSLIHKILPELKKENDFSRSITRHEVYKRFIKKLYHEKKNLIQQENGIRPGFNLFEAFDYLNCESSLVAWKLKESINLNPSMVAHHIHRAQLTENHETFIEYFIAEIIFDEIQNRCFTILKKVDLAQKASLLDFLSEKIHGLPEQEYIKFIHIVITALQQPFNSTAAPNLATLLTKLEVPFSGLSFNEVNFSSANIAGNIFHKTALQNTDFKNANAMNVFMRNTDCSNSDFTETNFGEYPSYTHDKHITAFYPFHQDDTGYVYYTIAYEDKIESYQLGMDENDYFSMTVPDEDDGEEHEVRLLTMTGDTPVYVKNNKVYLYESQIYPDDTHFDDGTPIVELRLSQNNEIDSEEKIEFYTHKSIYQFNFAKNFLEKITELPPFNLEEYKAFHISPDLTKIAYYTENKCIIFDIPTRSTLFEKEFTESIQQITIISLKNSDALCILFKNSEVIIIDILSKNIVYNLKSQNSIENFKLSDNLKVMGSISHDYEFDCGLENYVPAASTLHFNILPCLKQKIKNSKLYLRYSKVHPQKPLIIHCSDNHTIEIQHLTTKHITQKFRTLFEIIAFNCWGDNIYILGSEELIIWNMQNGNTEKINFEKDSWHDEYFARPRFSFFSEQCFVIFDGDKAYFFNNGIAQNISLKNIDWVSLANINRIIMGHSAHTPINDYDDGDYTKISLHVSEWNTELNRVQEIITLASHPCSIEESPLFELLTREDNLLTFMGGGKRTVYCCNLEQKTSSEIGYLPGYDIQKIAPTLFVCFSAGSKDTSERVAFFKVTEKVEELNSFKPTFFHLSPDDDYQNIELNFQWNGTLQLLMVYRSAKVSFWHIDIENNCEATLVYDHRDSLDLAALNLERIGIDPLNDLLLHQANDTDTTPEMLTTSFTLTEKKTFTDISPLPNFPNDVWLKILSLLSYSDRLSFSATSKKAYLMANDNHLNTLWGPLFSSNDISIAQKFITAYIKQLLINLMAYPLDETQPLEIKPSKITPHLLTMGFFSGGEKRIWDYPVKYIQTLSCLSGR